MLNLRLGCVNERAQLQPHRQMRGESALPWLQGLAALPLHVKGPASALMAPR